MWLVSAMLFVDDSRGTCVASRQDRLVVNEAVDDDRDRWTRKTTVIVREATGNYVSLHVRTSRITSVIESNDDAWSSDSSVRRSRDRCQLTAPRGDRQQPMTAEREHVIIWQFSGWSPARGGRQQPMMADGGRVRTMTRSDAIMPP